MYEEGPFESIVFSIVYTLVYIIVYTIVYSIVLLRPPRDDDVAQRELPFLRRRGLGDVL